MIRAIFLHGRAWSESLCSACYKTRAQFVAYLHSGKLVWSPSAKAVVPVRCDGTGTVVVSELVRLGYAPAPRFGNGEILLQARFRDAVIHIGRDTALSNNVTIVALQQVWIGSRCLIGDNVSLADSDFHNIEPAKRHDASVQSSPVRLGDNVWLGSRASVLKGVSIGDNTVVAAGSVVTRSIPPNVVAAGVPARVVRKLA